MRYIIWMEGVILNVRRELIHGIKEAIKAPFRPLLRHTRSIILRGLRDKYLCNSLEQLEVKAGKITGSRIPKNEKQNMLRSIFLEARINGPRRKDFRHMSVVIVSEAMASIGSYKEAILLVNQHIYEPSMRNDMIWQLIDKMFEGGLNKYQVVDVCKCLCGQVPGMYGIINDIYENYSLID